MGNPNQTISKPAYVKITDGTDSAAVTAVGHLQVDISEIATLTHLNVDISDGAGVALTSTLVGADQSLDVNVTQTVGGTVTEYTDDAAFTPDVSVGLAVGGYAGLGNTVDAGDWGAFAMTTHRELNVALSRGGFVVSVQPTWMAATQDEGTNTLSVGAGCFGYYAAGALNTKMRPLLIDLDDDTIAVDQTAQAVIPLNYYHDTVGTAWKRQQGVGGAANVAVCDSAGTAIDSEVHHADQALDVVEITGVNDINSATISPGVAPATQLPNVTPIRWIMFSARQTNAGNMLIGTGAVVHLQIPPGVTLPVMECSRGISTNTFWAQGAAGDFLDYFYGQSW